MQAIDPGKDALARRVLLADWASLVGFGQGAAE
jgi:hypothetical protein